MKDALQVDQQISLRELTEAVKAAGCIDPMWLRSFLRHCHDASDAANSIAQLRVTCPEKFGPVSRSRPAARREREQAPEKLPWSTINRLTRESGAVDRPMLDSYLKWCSSEEQARDVIESLRARQPAIWKRRVTPIQPNESSERPDRYRRAAARDHSR